MSWAVTRIERVRTEYAGWNEKCGYQGSGYPCDRGATGVLCGRFPPRDPENSWKSRVSLPIDTQRGGGLASRPIVPRRSRRQGFAREDPRSRAPRKTAAALTAALRRGAFDSGNPALRPLKRRQTVRQHRPAPGHVTN